MIKNDHQLKVTLDKIKNLKTLLYSETTKTTNPILIKSARLQTKFLIKNLENQVTEYNQMKSKL